MPLPMQGNKLLPGQQNVVRGSLLARAPDRRRGDRALDAGNEIGKAAPRQRSGEGGALLAGLVLQIWTELRGGMVGEDVDQRAFEFLRVDMTEFGRRKFLEMIVQ